MKDNEPFDGIEMPGDNREMFSIKVTFTGKEAWALAQMCKRFRYHHAEALSRQDEKTRQEAELMEAAVAKVRQALDKIGASPR